MRSILGQAADDLCRGITLRKRILLVRAKTLAVTFAVRATNAHAQDDVPRLAKKALLALPVPFRNGTAVVRFVDGEQFVLRGRRQLHALPG